MTAFMVIAVVMLMVSMTRRIRRVRYQAQVSTPEQDSPEQDGPGATDAAPGIAGAPHAGGLTAR
ncbi:hypothetical protein [Arthrobacter sp. Leaf137]|uniref:hypothetical protein n=1 Tax=Arthrobacter sp. Leaf137 TaxID=1736271 RepID=UPI0012E12484|nr:hypothetical protein [Arthrobacter sp. Leaf137]